MSWVDCGYVDRFQHGKSQPLARDYLQGTEISLAMARPTPSAGWQGASNRDQVSRMDQNRATSDRFPSLHPNLRAMDYLYCGEI